MGKSNFFKKRSENQSLLVSISTDTGRVRKANEDNFYADSLGIRERECLGGFRVLNDSDRYIFAVCDGMGGEQFGDTASEIAVKTLAEYSVRIKSAAPEKLHEIVNECVSEANNRICRMAEERNANLSGSTIAMVCTIGKQAFVFSVGDSRVYLHCENGLYQITEDQTLAMKKLKANIYTEEEAKLSPDSHKITTFLGVDSRGIGLKALEYEPISLENCSILICSDGLTDMCSDEEIEALMRNSDEYISYDLVDKALANGGADNVTCIVIKQV